MNGTGETERYDVRVIRARHTSIGASGEAASLGDAVKASQEKAREMLADRKGTADGGYLYVEQIRGPAGETAPTGALTERGIVERIAREQAPTAPAAEQGAVEGAASGTTRIGAVWARKRYESTDVGVEAEDAQAAGRAAIRKAAGHQREWSNAGEAPGLTLLRLHALVHTGGHTRAVALDIPAEHAERPQREDAQGAKAARRGRNAPVLKGAGPGTLAAAAAAFTPPRTARAAPARNAQRTGQGRDGR